MRRPPTKAALLLAALAALVLAGCDNGDIHSLRFDASGGCPVPEPYTINFGPGPTVNPDGSLTYGSSSVIIFNRPFTNNTQTSMCAEVTLTSSAFFAGGMAASAGNGIAVVLNWLAPGQIAVYFDDNNAGISCPSQTFSNPAYQPGGVVHLHATLDQTGAVPLMRGWVDSDPAGPPDLDSSTPWCAADSSGWSVSTGFEAYAQGSNMTVNRYGFGP